MPDNADIRVDIAMATFNGAQYLAEMLTSIEEQSHRNLRLVLSDDGSKDETHEVAQQHAEVLDLTIVPSAPRKGVLRNFEAALTATHASYVALCDQDDYWLPNKIELLLERLTRLEKEHGSNLPLLVFSDVEVVDQNLGMLKPSMFSDSIKTSAARRFPDYFLSSHVPGCSMMVNRALLDRALPFPDVEIHDWWLIQLATLFGKVDYVDQPLIKYRQHGNNAIGLGSSSGNPWIGRLRKVFKPFSFATTRLAKWRKQVISIRKALKALDAFGAGLPLAGREFVHAGLTSPNRAALSRLLAGAHTGEWPVDRHAIVYLLSRCR